MGVLLGEAKIRFLLEKEVEVVICYLMLFVSLWYVICYLSFVICYLLFVVVVVVVVVADGGGGAPLMVGHKKHQKLGSQPIQRWGFVTIISRACDVFFFQWWNSQRFVLKKASVSFFLLRGDWEGLTKCGKWQTNTVITDAKKELKRDWFIFCWKPTILGSGKNLHWSLGPKKNMLWRKTYTDIFRIGKTLTFPKRFIFQLTIAFQTCFIDNFSHRFTKLPFPKKTSLPKTLGLSPCVSPRPHRSNEIRLRLGYGSIVALVAQEIRGGWVWGVGNFEWKPLSLIFPPGLRERIVKNPRINVDVEGALGRISAIFFNLYGDRRIHHVWWIIFPPSESKATIHKTVTILCRSFWGLGLVERSMVKGVWRRSVVPRHGRLKVTKSLVKLTLLIRFNLLDFLRTHLFLEVNHLLGRLEFFSSYSSGSLPIHTDLSRFSSLGAVPQDAYKRLGSDIKKELNLKRVPWTEEIFIILAMPMTGHRVWRWNIYKMNRIDTYTSTYIARCFHHFFLTGSWIANRLVDDSLHHHLTQTECFKVSFFPTW